MRVVFDWDMATLGDPFVDLGTLLNYWPDPSDTPDDRAAPRPGHGTARPPAAGRRWSSATPSAPAFDVGAVHGTRRSPAGGVAVICQQLHQRYVRGESTDERMASRGDNVGMLARRAGRIMAEHELNEERRDRRSERQGRRRHRRQPRPRSGDGARLRRRRRRRRDRQPQAGHVRGAGRRVVDQTTGRRASPVACHVGRWDDVDRPRRRRSTRRSGTSTCSSTTPAWRRCTRAWSRSTEELFDKVIARQPQGPVPATALDRRAHEAATAAARSSTSAASPPSARQMTDMPVRRRQGRPEHDDDGLRRRRSVRGCASNGDHGRAVPHRHLQGVGRRRASSVRTPSATRSAARPAGRDRRTALYLASDVELHDRHGAHGGRRRVRLVALSQATERSTHELGLRDRPRVPGRAGLGRRRSCARRSNRSTWSSTTHGTWRTRCAWR